jgi:ATP-dependent Clp protease ATP-binding subunit ClpB
VLLQILEDGRLTDGQGRVVNFRNTVLIMTSNVGSAIIEQMSGGDEAMIEQSVREEMRNFFRPEFLNRIDEIIIFHRLTQEQITEIVDIQMARVLHRLEDRKISLTLSEEARTQLAKEGFDPVYGARPLKRAIQKEILDPLSLLLLEGKFTEGDAIVANVDDTGRFTFNRDNGK